MDSIAAAKEGIRRIAHAIDETNEELVQKFNRAGGMEQIIIGEVIDALRILADKLLEEIE